MRAWKLRSDFVERRTGLDYVALSLTGLGSDTAWELRERLLVTRNSGDTGWLTSRAYMAQGLAGLRSERAWEWRKDLLSDGASLDFVLRGIHGDWLMTAVRAAKGINPTGS